MSPPKHTLVRVCHLARCPVDCLRLVMDFLPIYWLVAGLGRSSKHWLRLMRTARVWRHFDLARLVDHSDVRMRAAAVARNHFWLKQLASGRFSGLLEANLATAELTDRDLFHILRHSPTIRRLDLSYCALFSDLSCSVLAEAPCCAPIADGPMASLRHLNVSFNRLFNGHTLAAALAPAGTLETLEVSNCTQLGGHRPLVAEPSPWATRFPALLRHR